MYNRSSEDFYVQHNLGLFNPPKEKFPDDFKVSARSNGVKQQNATAKGFGKLTARKRLPKFSSFIRLIINVNNKKKIISWQCICFQNWPLSLTIKKATRAVQVKRCPFDAHVIRLRWKKNNGVLFRDLCPVSYNKIWNKFFYWKNHNLQLSENIKSTFAKRCHSMLS